MSVYRANGEGLYRMSVQRTYEQNLSCICSLNEYLSSVSMSPGDTSSVNQIHLPYYILQHTTLHTKQARVRGSIQHAMDAVICTGSPTVWSLEEGRRQRQRRRRRQVLSHTHTGSVRYESLGSPAVTTSSRHALIASLKPCLFWVSEKRRLFGCSKMYIFFSYHLSLAESIVHVCVSVMSFFGRPVTLLLHPQLLPHRNCLNAVDHTTDIPTKYVHQISKYGFSKCHCIRISYTNSHCGIQRLKLVGLTCY